MQNNLSNLNENNKKIHANGSFSAVSLKEWLGEHHSEEDLRTVFLNMDRALKYIHDHGYCIEVFYITDIEILNNELDHIRFRKLMELPTDVNTRKEWIKEDIFKSSLIQTGVYSDSLKFLTPESLKENFDKIAEFVPSGDVPYYRGVIQRGASVYFCEYALEKRNRDLEELEKELGEESDTQKKFQKKMTNNSDITNNRVNDVIYRQINGLRDAAFVNLLMIPAIVLAMLLVFEIITFVVSLFS